MPFSGGIFQRLFNWATDRNGGVNILADRMDGEFDNYAVAINDIVNGTQPFTGTVKAPYGTVSAPGFQFSGDGDTGLVRTGSDALALVTGGAARVSVANDSVTLATAGVTRFTANTTALTSTLPLALPAGTVGSPGVNWNTNDGFYSPSAGVMALSLGGVEQLRWTATGQTGAIAPITGGDRYKVINGDFSVNQGGAITSGLYDAVSYPPSALTTTAGGTFDRWFPLTNFGAGGTFSSATNSAAIGHLFPARVFSITSASQSSAGSFAMIVQRIESARTYAGQTVTFFDWMKRATAGNVAFSIRQHFGTGGSPSADVTTYIGQAALTTSFAPYRFIASVPSVLGKTFGTNNNDYLEIVYWISAGSTYNATTGSLGLANTTVDFYGVHDRLGNLSIEVINNYQPPDPQTELAKCQRYFEAMTDCMRVSSSAPIMGQATFATQKRAVPTISNLTYSSGTGATFSATKTSVVQLAAHSSGAIVNTLWASAEL